MKELIVTCDHCGKLLNQSRDYIDKDFDIMDNWLQSDLCLECYTELSQIIKEFCGRN